MEGKRVKPQIKRILGGVGSWVDVRAAAWIPSCSELWPPETDGVARDKELLTMRRVRAAVGKSTQLIFFPLSPNRSNL
jgi:hypothetical protein